MRISCRHFQKKETSLPIDLSQYLVIGISSRALFDLSEENRLYAEQGEEYQLPHEDDILKSISSSMIRSYIVTVQTSIGLWWGGRHGWG